MPLALPYNAPTRLELAAEAAEEKLRDECWTLLGHYLRENPDLPPEDASELVAEDLDLSDPAPDWLVELARTLTPSRPAVTPNRDRLGQRPATALATVAAGHLHLDPWGNACTSTRRALRSGVAICDDCEAQWPDSQETDR
jgi:hypothetical protein